MLSQIERWMDYAGSGADLILLLRILGLRLQRKYIFITLLATLEVLFDGVGLALAKGSPEEHRVQAYSWILIAFVIPAAVWDVFEELEEKLADLRRMALWRTVTSLLLIAGFALLSASMIAKPDDSTGMAGVVIFSWVLLMGSSTGGLGFLWSIQRVLRRSEVSVPSNTTVWLYYFGLFLAGELVACFFPYVDLLFQKLPTAVPQIEEIGLNVYFVAITVWCAWKLKAVPATDMPSASLNENQ